MQPVNRLYSIDVFRAVNMFFMIFVNDLSGVRNVPGWIEHVKANEDGLHFADTIFPVFLFIAGLSVPLAIGRRLRRGEPVSKIMYYILLRAGGLIIMGFFHVNLENYNKEALLPVGVWELLLTLSFFLIWLDYPAELSKAKKYFLMGAGIVILIFLAAVYKGGSMQEPEGLRPYWWGILGIIGWAYLVSAGIFVLTKGKLLLLTGFLLVFIGLNISLHASFFDMKLWVINDGASISLMLLGVVISVIYNKMALENNYSRLWFTLISIGTLLIIAGFAIRPYTEGISKIHSTPAWVFICGGIGVLFFAMLIWLTDIKGNQNWFNVIKTAGTSTLTCYLLPYLIVAIFQITDFAYPHFLSNGIGGIFRSIAMAFIVILIAGFLEKKRLRLQL